MLSWKKSLIAIVTMGCVFSFLARNAALSGWRKFMTFYQFPQAALPLDLMTATAEDMQRLMSEGTVSNAELIQRCLAQIEQYDGYLKAMLTIGPRALEQALLSDTERQAGNVRGPLHGIPVLIKDNIETGPRLAMDTTAGSYALLGAESYQEASVIKSLLRSGAIILGKAQLSEFAFYKGTGLPSGWSALGGQCQSAYTTDDVVLDDGIMGYSSPGGSSTGSAVGVSIGYAPIGIGTDTTGSVIIPATRAALYALRFTTGSIPRDGIIPFSKTFDTVGIMAKTVADLLHVATAIAPSTPTEQGALRQHLRHRGSWSDLKVGVLAPEVWNLPSYAAKPNSDAERQLIDDTRAAYAKIKPLVRSFKQVRLISYESVEGEDGVGIWDVFRSDFQQDLDDYLHSLKKSRVRTVEDLVKFNRENAALELPEGYSTQDLLEGSLSFKLSEKARKEAMESIRANSTTLGIEKTLKENDIDVILAPGDSGINLLCCAGGYPAAAMPLSYLRFNNRPFGVIAVSRRNQEGILFDVMEAWQATFPARKPPPKTQPAR